VQGVEVMGEVGVWGMVVRLLAEGLHVVAFSRESSSFDRRGLMRWRVPCSAKSSIDLDR
jgi:hypothetical protein